MSRDIFKIGTSVTTRAGLLQEGWDRPVRPGSIGVVVEIRNALGGLFGWRIHVVEWEGGRRTPVINAHILLERVSSKGGRR